MLGRDHALLGALGYTTIVHGIPTLTQTIHNGGRFFWLDALTVSAHPTSPVWNGPQFSAPVDLMWMATFAGMALVPDLDEPQSTVARLFGWPSMAFSALCRKALGGHRYGSHSWLFVVMSAVFAIIGTLLPPVGVVTIMICLVLAARMLLPDRGRGLQGPVMILTAVLGGLAYFGKVSMAPSLWVFPMGILFHILGDWVTGDPLKGINGGSSGVAWMWPVTRERWSLNWFLVGSEAEAWIVRPIMLLMFVPGFVWWIGIPLLKWFTSPEAQALLANYVGIVGR